jgi:predicted TPR repeat methyltransferase
MLSVELVHLADILDGMGHLKNVSKSAREWSSQIKKAIWNHTVRLGCGSGYALHFLKGLAFRLQMVSLRTKPMVLVADTSWTMQMSLCVAVRQSFRSGSTDYQNLSHSYPCRTLGF